MHFHFLMQITIFDGGVSIISCEIRADGRGMCISFCNYCDVWHLDNNFFFTIILLHCYDVKMTFIKCSPEMSHVEFD